MYEDSIREEFTHQSGSFGKAAVMTSAETLGALVELVPEDAEARWLESACGTGLVSRALAGKVGSVTGVDLTPAMLEQAERGAAEDGVENVSFAVGDATALEFADGSFDGAVTRLSLHHIPLPGRVIAELARVVRPGGWVIVGDLVADEADGEAAAWREEIERLRDPSHWALPHAGAAAGDGRRGGPDARARAADPDRASTSTTGWPGARAAQPRLRWSTSCWRSDRREPRASASRSATRAAACTSATGSAAGAARLRPPKSLRTS